MLVTTTTPRSRPVSGADVDSVQDREGRRADQCRATPAHAGVPAGPAREVEDRHVGGAGRSSHPGGHPNAGLALPAGAAIALAMLWMILSGPHAAAVIDHHVVYVTGLQPSAALGLGYLAATSVSLLLPSRPAVMLLGALVLVGSVTAFAIYWDAFTSVWCFFAAAASLVTLGQVEWSHRRRGRLVDA